MTPEERIALERKRYVQKRYRQCIENHECVNCRTVDERTLAGHIRCERCNRRAYQLSRPVTQEQREKLARDKRERRRRRSEKQQCHECGRQDYLTLRGRPLCALCQRKRNESERAYHDSGRLAEYQRSRRAAFKAAGMCSKCGKNPPESGRALCTDCLVRDRMYRWRKKQKETMGE